LIKLPKNFFCRYVKLSRCQIIAKLKYLFIIYCSPIAIINGGIFPSRTKVYYGLLREPDVTSFIETMDDDEEEAPGSAAAAAGTFFYYF